MEGKRFAVKGSRPIIMLKVGLGLFNGIWRLGKGSDRGTKRKNGKQRLEEEFRGDFGEIWKVRREMEGEDKGDKKKAKWG